MGPTRNPEPSVQNQLTLRNIPEDARIQVNRSWSLGTRKLIFLVNKISHVLSLKNANDPHLEQEENSPHCLTCCTIIILMITVSVTN
jgi:hypothetical protein